MTKLTFIQCFIALLCAYTLSGYAADDSSMLLSCNVKSENFPGVKDTLQRKEVRLHGSQTTDLGRKKIMDLGHYQLWAETYAMSFTGKPQIIDYVVKILNTKTRQAAIAHSGVHPHGGSGLAATVRQVHYKEDGKHEAGFINLRCLSFGLPSPPKMEPLDIK